MTPKKPQSKSEYSAKQITVLEGLEPVHKRPAMYIGNTAKEGLHHLVWEVVDNAIDEAMAGYCKEITVSLLPDSAVQVTDNGRGIPVDIHKPTKKSALEVVMTKLHAGGKFGQGGYKVSGGLHGVGVSVVNALSQFMRAEVRRNGKLYMQEYKQGKPLKKVKAIGKARGVGTTITFQPDSGVFSTLEFDFNYILDHLRQQAYLTKGIKIIVNDERTDEELSYTFCFEGGIASYVRHLNRKNEAKHENIFYVDKEQDEVRVEVALQYVDEYKETVFSFANNIFTTEGGMHLVGFRAALTRVLNTYARRQGILKEKDENLTGDDVREGLTAVVSVKVKEPQFEGQTKAKLGNAEVRPIVENVFADSFNFFLEEHPRDAESILGKALLASQARRAARAARDSVLRKGAMEGFALPGKLADCSSKDPSRSELYIVEGDSAGGCFCGDTQVALLDGRDVSFKELIQEDKGGKRNYCYTIKKDGGIDVALIKNPRKTKRDVKVIKVILDNDKEIVCTPDHKFMLRDGSYVKAKDLRSDMPLMPLRRKLSMIEAVENYNHKIKKVVPLKQKIDVYDLEVEGTHNFALGSGVFVHNSAKQGRNREFQAILPLRGKILNVERARLDKMLANNEIKSLIIALGTNIGEQFDISKLRYDRIIIMTDADVDGAHIRTLLLTFFYRYFPEIITQGHLYIAQPPLYRIQIGKDIRYAYTDEELERVQQEMLTQREKTKSKRREKEGSEEETEEYTTAISIQRYKGLGEMNPTQLWETTMDPAFRTMKQVTIEDAEKADDIFETLMGSEVSPRKRFIQTHAKSVKNLDI